MNNLTSCLYESKITHQRLHPKRHRVKHSMFSFYLDLDELQQITKHSRLLAVNNFALYALFDRDHFDEGNTSLKQKVIDHVESIHPRLQITHVHVLTSLRFLNYVFNPITVFFCFDDAMKIKCAVAEVGNTFGEKKPYLILSDGSSKLKDKQKKNFYISPFISLDADVVFDIDIPNQKLTFNIDTVENGQTVLAANMHGTKCELTDKNLLALTFKYPFVTFFVVGAIHFHALILWLKRVPFITKEANRHQQTGILRPHPSLGDHR
ncbi:MAG: DUF1365 domain-containing protein [Cyanobacteria bacterium SZAS-4]|nr:DUF1365 domain-containing protein [Cyanobacteria bacterium SZAS-4]